MSSYAQETSYVQNNGESDEELDDSGKGDSRSIQLKHTNNMVVVDNEDLESTKEDPVKQEAPAKKYRMFDTPPKKFRES